MYWLWRQGRYWTCAMMQAWIQKSAEGVIKPNFANKVPWRSKFNWIFGLFWGFCNGKLGAKGCWSHLPLKRPLDPRLQWRMINMKKCQSISAAFLSRSEVPLAPVTHPWNLRAPAARIWKLLPGSFILPGAEPLSVISEVRRTWQELSNRSVKYVLRTWFRRVLVSSFWWFVQFVLRLIFTEIRGKSRRYNLAHACAVRFSWKEFCLKEHKIFYVRVSHFFKFHLTSEFIGFKSLKKTAKNTLFASNLPEFNLNSIASWSKDV